MRCSAFVQGVLLAMVVACVPAEEEPVNPGEGEQPVAVAPNFNGGFEGRDIPPLSACVGSGDSIACPWPTSVPAGWTVSPAEVFSAPRGHGGLFFQYGVGRIGSAPLQQFPGIPHGTALFLQACNVDHDPTWCSGIATVESVGFPITGGGAYTLSLWLRSSLFLSFGSPTLHLVSVGLIYFDSNNKEVARATFPFTPNVAPVGWTQNRFAIDAPPSATSARLLVNIDRNRRTAVYIDDVELAPR